MLPEVWAYIEPLMIVLPVQVLQVLPLVSIQAPPLIKSIYAFTNPHAEPGIAVPLVQAEVGSYS